MKIGSLNFNKPVFLAPMEDVTDLSFRLICRQMGADMVYTEFTSSEAIIRDIPKALRKIEISDAERPVGIQLFGGVEESMEGATQKAEKFRPDIIDINCGCWVKNHVNRGEGAGLLRDLNQFEKIVKATVRSTKLPVTVKTRLGWDEKSIVILDVAKMVEQAGAQALTLHCRTRSQAHDGRADWDWLAKVKKVISIPLIGNGDLNSAQDVKRMFESGCDGAMIGRAAIGNPWIFKQSRHFLDTDELLAGPTIEEKINVCLRHLQMAVERKGLKYGVSSFRKYYAGYLRGFPNVASLRSDIMQLMDVESIQKRMQQFLEQHASLASMPLS
jgi:tRNA-dihydrouridine synthase B